MTTSRFSRVTLMVLLAGLSIPALAAYKTCGTSLVSYSTNTCPDGIVSTYHSGDPLSFTGDIADFGTVTIGASSATKVMKISNISGYTISLPNAPSVSPSSFSIVGNSCGSSLAVGASCEVKIAFKPTAAGLVNGTLSVTTVSSSTPFSMGMYGTGAAVVPTLTGVTLSSSSAASGEKVTLTAVPSGASLGTCTSSNSAIASVSGTTVTAGSTTGTATLSCSGFSVTLNVTAPAATHATKPTPTTCSASLAGNKLSIPYLLINGSPNWAMLESSGDISAYKVTDYGFVSATASCAADGANFDGTTLNIAKLSYGGVNYKVVMKVGFGKDGSITANLVSGEKIVAPATTPTTTPTTTPGTSTSSLQAVLPGTWALHGGVARVTFKDDGTYSSDNGGTGTYTWSGNTLQITGSLTSGKPGTGVIDVAASATWLEVYWMSSYGYETGLRYYKMK